MVEIKKGSSMYNFKGITAVPNSKDFIDITLSKTQRKTPTVVHPNYNITRIRDFYLRKIKTTQTNFHERLDMILQQFPKLDDIHPFYADLMNVLYDKDHYKVACGDINRAKSLIDGVARDYGRLMKYADSLYRCKNLKRAALGRMATIIKRQNSTLEYLEQVRQHLARLPSIDPNTRTVIVCGFPNVGKSSMMNKLSRAEVEVQPYAFTTKALYVGHFDYNYLPWQIIDTPGILDKPLEERNTIEMLSITALAHLNAAVVYVMDISEQCGHSLEEQAKLFENIRPLFANKPLRIMMNKCDIVNPENLNVESKKMIEELTNPKDFDQKSVPINFTSTVTEEGLMNLRNSICDELLSQRVDAKLKAKTGINKEEMMGRLRVAIPKKRDEVIREAYIPEGFKPKAKTVDRNVLGPLPKVIPAVTVPAKRTERDLELEQDYDYVLELQKHWDLANPEEQYDTIPEIINGKNIADFIDPEIDAKVAALMAEEEERIKNGFYEIDRSDDDDQTTELRELGQKIRKVKNRHIQIRRRETKIQAAQLDRRGRTPGSAKDLKKKMEKLGLDLENWESKDAMDDGENSNINAINRGRSRVQRKRARSASAQALINTDKARSLQRSQSRPGPRDQSGMRDETQIKKAKVLKSKGLTKIRLQARRGESDRHIPDLKPKHLNVGKRGIGKTDRR